MATSPTARRLQYREDLRATILDSARELFLEEGVEAFSMRKLAARVGYSAASLYQYFPGREAILRELIDESFRAFAAAQAQAARDGDAADPAEELRRGLRNYVRFGLENPNHYRLAFMAPTKSEPTQTGQMAFEALRRRVQACMEAGVFRPVEVELAAQSLWVAVHGVTSLLLVRPMFPWADREQLIEQVIRGAMDGLRP